MEKKVEKKVGAILLIAGTCIGSGMIALPMVLAKVGLIPSIGCMLFTWFVMYYTSLINLELNLQAGHGLSLGSLARYFSGKYAQMLGVISLKLLSYSLLAVFIYGGSSILQELLATKMEAKYSFNTIATWYAIAAMALLLLPIKLIDYFNRILFIGLLAIVAVLIAGLAISIDWSDLPLFSEQYNHPATWALLIPVVFTSFGFQVIFHTLTNYCNKNVKVLKQAFFWGSLIPAIVYILWTYCILSVIHHDDPSFYAKMASGQVEVGQLIQALSTIAKWQTVQLLVWWISLLAIATSVLGVGVGLYDSLKIMLAAKVHQPHLCSVLASVLTVVPAYIVVIFVPNAFISVLGFAGMILAVIAVLLPAYLFHYVNKQKLHYPELRRKWLIRLSVVFAIMVIACELFNIVSR